MNSVSKKNKYEIDMCNGSIMDKLISFSLPLMLSGILQLMFNAVDIVVVGRFSGSQALAAVGSTTSLINMFTNLFIGVSLGANVLAARFYASGRSKEMSETVHTSITFALISGIVMVFAGLFFSRLAFLDFFAFSSRKLRSFSATSSKYTPFLSPISARVSPSISIQVSCAFSSVK